MGETTTKVRYLTLHITQELAGTEVNTLLRRTLGLSGTVLRRVKWLADGITLDGARVNVRYRVTAGQVLSVRLSDPEGTPQPVPSPGPLDILYEDADMVVVNKAAGVLVHPSHGHYADTVGNFLMAHYRRTARLPASTRSTGWTREPPACWWPPSTPTAGEAETPAPHRRFPPGVPGGV